MNKAKDQEKKCVEKVIVLTKRAYFMLASRKHLTVEVKPLLHLVALKLSSNHF
jgi:hypothetical protein